ncbi:hypothetical protein SAMN04488564_102613 [Lentzea waywayandensis]|uniref:Uncharacterized protein n=1 Tax=Lentzea waywayandensis TaxID=84724 RepID=A0A1I6DHC3_9PSEU|nr:WD40 repeat domain-containing protein [Lentzea waywayandensis]SFR04788.1 hypothetical protein SAMN04488564_102613 [Lentzea waywayandensis]
MTDVAVCPVCATSITGDVCGRCGWLLRTGWRISPGPGAAATFERGLERARLRFDLVTATRAAAGDRAMLDRTEAFVRGGPPDEDDRAWARVQLDSSAGRGPASPRSVAREVLERRKLTVVSVLDVRADAVAAHTFDVQPDGVLRERAELVRYTWPMLVPDLPEDEAAQAFRLAGGTGRFARNPAAHGVLLRVPGWEVPERLVAGTGAEVVVRRDGGAGDVMWSSDAEITAWTVRDGTVVGGARDGSVRGWTFDGASAGVVPLLGGAVSAVDGARDRTVWLAGGWDGDVRLRDEHGSILLLPAHQGRVNGVRAGDGIAVSLGDDGVINRSTVDRAGAEPMRPILAGGQGGAVLASTSDGAVAAAAGGDRVVRVYDTWAGELIHEVPASAGVVALDLDDRARFLAVGCADGSAHVHDLRSERGWSASAGRSAVTAVAVVAGGDLVTADAAGEVVWWPARNRKRVLIGCHRGAVRGLALTGDGHVVSAGRQDGVVRVWSIPAVEEGGLG